MKKNRFKKYIASLPAIIVRLFVISVIFVAIYDFCLKKTPELFNGAAELGIIFYGLCFAYITAFIFYFLTSHYPKMKERYRTYDYVVRRIDYFISYMKSSMIKNLERLNGGKFKAVYPADDELDALLKLEHNHIDWDKEMAKITEFVVTEVRRVIDVPNLDIDIYNLLLNLDDCTLYENSKQMARRDDVRMSFSDYLPCIKEFLSYCEELEKYRDVKLSMYPKKELKFINSSNPLVRMRELQ